MSQPKIEELKDYIGAIEKVIPAIPKEIINLSKKVGENEFEARTIFAYLCGLYGIAYDNFFKFAKQYEIIENDSQEEKEKAINNDSVMQSYFDGQCLSEAIPVLNDKYTIAISYIENIEEKLKAVRDAHLYSSSLISSIEQGKDVSAQWGTDLDIKALGITEDSKDVKQAGTHILTPISICASGAEADLLKKAVDEVKGKHIAGNVTLYIPFTVGQYGGHWRLLEIKISNNVIQSGTVYDSLNGQFDKKSPPSYVNDIAMQLVDKPIVTVQYSGKQTDGHNCAFYATQKALELQGKQSDPLNQAIVNAQDGNALRAASLRLMASKKQNPDISAKIIAAADTISHIHPAPPIKLQAAKASMPDAHIKEETIQSIKETIKSIKEIAIITQNFLSTASANSKEIKEAQDAVWGKFADTKIKTQQEDFDDVFANKLQDGYDKNKSSSDDKKIEEKAFVETIRHFSM